MALIAAMYASLLDKYSFDRRIKRIIKDSKDPAILKMVEYIKKQYKKIREQRLIGSLLLAAAIEKMHILEHSHTVAYEVQRRDIGKTKEAFIMSDIQANRTMNKWFYLCSSHTDSAEDHKPWQGKVYIDENCNDPKCLALANEYHMKSYQWVIGQPVWMVTRPNCRHYFKSLTYNEVAGNSYEDLIKKHNMHREIGDRSIMQTLKGGDNVEIVIKSYEERLRMHLAMNRIRPNQFLQRAIDKDRLLLKKWKNKL